MSEYKQLLDTLKELNKREDANEILNIINVVANLMFELGNVRDTSATYQRRMKHGRLIVDLSYNGK